MNPWCVMFVFVGVVTMGCTKGGTNWHPVVEIQVGNPVDTIKGTLWPRRPDGSLSDVHAIEEPRQVMLKFHSGRTCCLYSKMLLIDQEDGLIWIVNIMPFEKAQNYDDAVLEAGRLVSDIEQIFAVPAANSVQTKVRDWSGNKPQAGPRTTRVEIERNVSLFIALRPTNDTDERWFLSLEFSAEERRGNGKDVPLEVKCRRS